MGESDIRKSHAIVAMLDALDVRNATMQEAESFISILQKIDGYIPTFLESLIKLLPPDFHELYAQTAFHTHTFGDSVILVWEVPSSDALYKPLLLISQILSYMLIAVLENGLRFRGAISLGDIVYSKQNVLGPAITDVASWYEEADWMGVIATPHCGHHIKYLQTHYGSVTKTKDGKQMAPLHLFFVEWDVPIKTHVTPLWVVNWPRLVSLLRKDVKPLPWYFEKTKRFFIPLGTEQKYRHTEDFIRRQTEETKPQPAAEGDGSKRAAP